MKTKSNSKLAGGIRIRVGTSYITAHFAFIGALVFAACAGLVFAQGWTGSSRPLVYDSKRPPPLTLPEAYAAAVARVGYATNRFHCVSATCLDSSNKPSTGWVFGFSNTNGDRAGVK